MRSSRCLHAGGPPNWALRADKQPHCDCFLCAPVEARDPVPSESYAPELRLIALAVGLFLFVFGAALGIGSCVTGGGVH